MPAGTQARPYTFLQYSLAVDSSATGVGAALVPLITDLSSSPGGVLIKSTNTRFEALVNCTVVVSYGTTAQSATNQEGFQMRVLNTGTLIPQSVAGGRTGSGANEACDVSRTFITNLTAGQYLELQLNKLEANTITLQANSTYMLVEVKKVG